MPKSLIPAQMVKNRGVSPEESVALQRGMAGVEEESTIVTDGCRVTPVVFCRSRKNGHPSLA